MQICCWLVGFSPHSSFNGVDHLIRLSIHRYIYIYISSSEPFPFVMLLHSTFEFRSPRSRLLSPLPPYLRRQPSRDPPCDFLTRSSSQLMVLWCQRERAGICWQKKERSNRDGDANL